VASSTQVVLAVIAIAIALAGIFIAGLVYLRRRIPAGRFELPLFLHGWYYDEAIGAFVAGPGTAFFNGVATFDAKVIDGAVNGAAGIVGWFGSRLRRVQTGYVRNYALEIAVGTIVLVGLFLVKGL
jgi:NADH-quinone oxidoreductase subunit L